MGYSRRREYVRVLMADVVPDLTEAEEPIPERKKWAVVRRPCPDCDLLCLWAATDLADPDDQGTIRCSNRECGFAVTGQEAADLHAGANLPRMFHDSIVYYMTLGGMVKIGFSYNIRSRVETIRPQGVAAVEWGGRVVETQRHREFAACRSHREWFFLTEQLANHIADLRERWEAETGQTTEAWLTEHGVEP